jgi:hypothetical protein
MSERAEVAKEFRDTDEQGGEERTQEGADHAERTTQIHVPVVSAENGGKPHSLGSGVFGQIGLCDGNPVSYVRALSNQA